MSVRKAHVILVGFLDTKGAEHAFVANFLRSQSVDVSIIDVSITEGYAHAPLATHSPSAVCSAASASGEGLQESLSSVDRSKALEILTRGAKSLLQSMHQAGNVHGVLALGGSTTTALACDAMSALPIGLPKLCVSTMVAGDISSYVGESDIGLTPAIVDFPGTMNSISEKVLGNATAAMAGMAKAYEAQKSGHDAEAKQKKKRVALTMFGVTTPAVSKACEILGEEYETVVFHCTGAGGRSMERLIQEGWFDGVLDLTTSELVDEHCGGVLSAGKGRLTSAGKCGIPQVISLGALDMCNFGPRATVPEKYRDRKLHEHNPSVTVMRTNVDESKAIGQILAEKAAAATGPTAVIIPTGGFSMLDEPNKPFWDPEVDKVLIDAVKEHLRKAVKDGSVELVEKQGNVNNEAFVQVCVDKLLSLMKRN